MTDGQLQIRSRLLAVLWILAVIAASIHAVATVSGNFDTFRTSALDLLAGRDIYAANGWLFKYTPTFPLLFAPFAALPIWLGILLWNAVNAGALYWSLGRIFGAEEALVARSIVLLDVVGNLQNVQSNALVAGLIVLAFADLERRNELRAAVAVALGALIKVFPLAAAAFAVFRPYRLPRFMLLLALVLSALLAAPLLVVSPAELASQYRSWMVLQRLDALARDYSVMQHLHLWLGFDGPNWVVQVAGIMILLAPLVRLSYWGVSRFRLLFLASVLMFCVLFNHKAESPSFLIAMVGVAVWFAVSARDRRAWAVLVLVFLGTVLSASDAMPHVLQRAVFEPYQLKTLPVLLVWVLTQMELWRQNLSGPLRAPEFARAAPVT